MGCLEKRYDDMLEEGKTIKEALDILGVTRYCCRRMFLGRVDTLDKQILFPDPVVNDFAQKKKTE